MSSNATTPPSIPLLPRDGATPSLLTVVRRSEAASEAVLLLPGLGASAATWQAVIELLPRHYDLVYGPGVAQGPASSSRLRAIPALADAVSRELAALPYEKYQVVSHSLGGFLALELATLQAHPISRLVLANGGLQYVAELLDRPRRMIEYPIQAVAAAWLLTTVCFPSPPWLLRQIAARQTIAKLFLWPFATAPVIADSSSRRTLVESSGHPDLLLGLRVNRHHWRHLLSIADAVQTPVVVLTGRHDPLAPPVSAARFACHFRDARMIEVPGARHCLPFEAPGDIVAAIGDGQATGTGNAGS